MPTQPPSPPQILGFQARAAEERSGRRTKERMLCGEMWELCCKKRAGSRRCSVIESQADGSFLYYSPKQSQVPYEVVPR